MDNTFIFGAATKDECFIDRENDVKRLSANFRGGISTILISPRRWGKTSLVLKVADIVRDAEMKVVVFDMFSCKSEQDFYRMFATEVIKQTASKWEEWMENGKRFLSALAPKFSFSSDPGNEFSMSFDVSNKALNEEVLKLPQRVAQAKGVHVIVCIDEFQQVGEIADSVTFQKKLRSVWQLQYPDVSYCFFGSKKHLLSAIFAKPSMPFYKFGDILFLKKIETEHWIPYICRQFRKTGREISENFAERICQTVDNHSSYVQQFAWLVLNRTATTTTEAEFAQAYDDLLNQNSTLFRTYIGGLTELQINFLRALSDGVCENFSRNEILQRYNLVASANITRLRKSLEDKELIDITQGKITFNDPVFRIWFRKEIFNK